jgi:hypothetical protein
MTPSECPLEGPNQMTTNSADLYISPMSATWWFLSVSLAWCIHKASIHIAYTSFAAQMMDC